MGTRQDGGLTRGDVLTGSSSNAVAHRTSRLVTTFFSFRLRVVQHVIYRLGAET